MGTNAGAQRIRKLGRFKNNSTYLYNSHVRYQETPAALASPQTCPNLRLERNHVQTKDRGPRVNHQAKGIHSPCASATPPMAAAKPQLQAREPTHPPNTRNRAQGRLSLDSKWIQIRCDRRRTPLAAALEVCQASIYLGTLAAGERQNHFQVVLFLLPGPSTAHAPPAHPLGYSPISRPRKSTCEMNKATR